MVLSEITTMLNLLREVVGRKAELDKNFLENFIDPTWDTFTTIHNNYKETFFHYTEMVQDENITAEDIINKIKMDSMYSEDLRTNLGKLMYYLPQNDIWVMQGGTAIQQFLAALRRYFSAQISFFISESIRNDEEMGVNINYEDLPLPNRPRYIAIIKLSRQGSVIDREWTKYLLEGIIKDIQKRYEFVADKYYAIRKELLT